jgi:hypothetical protein
MTWTAVEPFCSENPRALETVSIMYRRRLRLFLTQGAGLLQTWRHQAARHES